MTDAEALHQLEDATEKMGHELAKIWQMIQSNGVPPELRAQLICVIDQITATQRELWRAIHGPDSVPPNFERFGD